MTPTHILFAASDTGSGHRSAAVAIGAALQELAGDSISYEILDVLQATGLPIARDAAQVYSLLSTSLLPLYNLAFTLTNEPQRVEFISKIVASWARTTLATRLRKAQPQLIVATHPLVQRFVHEARQAAGLENLHLITVVTDLVSLHHSWAYPAVDLCIAPTSEAYNLLLQWGIPSAKLRQTGFPVHPKFAHFTASQADARQALGLAPDRFTILITSGGVGSGKIAEVVAALERAFPLTQTLVVTGNNKALLTKLRANPRSSQTKLYGFVENMEALMVASDVVVTKAGPGTLMEALVLRRPVIITEAIGKQEEGNITFVTQRQLGFHCPTTAELVKALQILAQPQEYQTFVARMTDAVPREGASQIAQMILAQIVQQSIPVS
jgi:UDP-N-acetylglucosamine:LPS N-acetylglucosamine transferase